MDDEERRTTDNIWRNAENYQDPTPAQAEKKVDEWAHQMERQATLRRAYLAGDMVRGLIGLSGFTWRGYIVLEDETGYRWIINADRMQEGQPNNDGR